jgi:hypothetical protein
LVLNIDDIAPDRQARDFAFDQQMKDPDPVTMSGIVVAERGEA